MEFIKNTEIEVLSNPGVESFQLLNPKNSDSRCVTITKVLIQSGAIQPRYVTSPPIDFGYAYKKSSKK